MLVAAPYAPNPCPPAHRDEVGIDRGISAVLLGIMGDDANLLIVEKLTR